MLIYTVRDEAGSWKLADELAQLLRAGDVLLLEGELGAGKTTFTKGIAHGLGITRYVKSPTFTLIREYQEGRIPLYHMDVYRLENGGGSELGLDEYFSGDGVCVIEWSQFIADELPAEFLKIEFAKDAEDEQKRTLMMTAVGTRYQNILSQLSDVLEDE